VVVDVVEEVVAVVVVVLEQVFVEAADEEVLVVVVVAVWFVDGVEILVELVDDVAEGITDVVVVLLVAGAID
jgi:hypothetical protein